MVLLSVTFLKHTCANVSHLRMSFLEQEKTNLRSWTSVFQCCCSLPAILWWHNMCLLLMSSVIFHEVVHICAQVINCLVVLVSCLFFLTSVFYLLKFCCSWRFVCILQHWESLCKINILIMHVFQSQIKSQGHSYAVPWAEGIWCLGQYEASSLNIPKGLCSNLDLTLCMEHKTLCSWHPPVFILLRLYFLEDIFCSVQTLGKIRYSNIHLRHKECVNI